ncbi:MAG: hypothetical protein HW380_3614 [Magnetococcales bacterium]|nr:hypothetical protein [Magnetococcales bacterium]HIJ84894.1 hypothetical protein [Magnetococcales bacterium]
MENSPFSSTDWMRSWAELQQKFWQDPSNMFQNSWLKTVMPNMPMDFVTKTMGNMSPMWNPLAMFQTAGTQDMVVKNLMSSMNGFTQMGQSILTLFQSMGDATKTGEWTSMVEKTVEQFRNMMAGATDNPFAFPFFNPMGPMNQSVESFNQLLASNPLFSQLSGGLPANMGPNALLHTILGFPGVGIGREKQEVMQRAMSFGMDFQKSFTEYQALKNNMKVKALEKLQGKMIELGKGEKKIDTLRGAFVLWIDCLEEAHAELVTSDKYLEVNARMVKDMMNFRKTVQELTDDFLAAMNVPNRRELDAAYKKIQLLKRQVREIDDEIKEIRALSGGGGSGELKRLQETMASLDAENLRIDLEALQIHVEKTLGAVPVSEKKMGRKKANATKDETEKKGA